MTQQRLAKAMAEATQMPDSDFDTAKVTRLAYQYGSERGAPIDIPKVDWVRAEEDIRLRRKSHKRRACTG